MFTQDFFRAGPKALFFKRSRFPVMIQKIPSEEKRGKDHRHLLAEQSQEKQSERSENRGSPLSLAIVGKAQHSTQKKTGGQQILASGNVSHRCRLYRMAHKQ